MFLADRLRAARVLSVGVASVLVAGTVLVASAPAQADEVYPRPWDDTITLSGHGYGHGHGMSQWGAYGAAKSGLTVREILAFYYPGTKVEDLGNKTIRVRLDAVGSGTLYVDSAAGLQLEPTGKPPVALPQVDPDGKPITRYRVYPLAATSKVRIEGFSNGLWKRYSDLVSPAVFSNPSRGSLVDVRLKDRTTRRTYRGRISANWATTTTLKIVNRLPMESYLRAVVPAEMSPSWHQNALASQAVAARSYANHDRENAPAGRTHDTCDTTSCQMYSGVQTSGEQTEHPLSDAAIVASAGKTLTYQGQAAFTQFSAANGGWSTAGSRPYLVTRADPYDGVVPNPPNTAHSWTTSIKVASIEARWRSTCSYRRLRIISRDGHGQWGGRVLQMAIEGSAGTVSVKGTDFRTAFGLKSEWFIPTNLRSAPSYPRDFTGDRLADVLAVRASNGELRQYPGNGASGWKPMSVIGTGFGGLPKVLTAGTWDRGAISDVIAQKPDGTLWLYPGIAAGPLGTPRQIGSGWGIYNHVFAVGDFGGDGLSDLMARSPDGRLMLYSGNGTGGFLTNTRQVGSGWGGFTSIFSPGDFNGDGTTDVMARTSDGLLYLYPGNGFRGWLPRRLIGSGWNGFSAIISPGDFSGDRKSDLLARRPDGTLWMYRGDGAGGFLPRQVVGTGWNAFSRVLS